MTYTQKTIDSEPLSPKIVFMKYIILIALLMLTSCTKPKVYCECMTVYHPLIIMPKIEQVPCFQVPEIQGQTGEFTDALGNHVTYEIICK
ncbi:hypothetical protein LLG07_03480 [bacterium]|nr:hypothetical protein [bacterium]